MKLLNKKIIIISILILIICVGVIIAINLIKPVNDKNSKVIEKQDISGIGVVIEEISRRIFVNNVVKGSPASEAGITMGDEVYTVNGRCARYANIDNITNELRGPAGTTVNLKIIHKNVPQEVKIIRKKITFIPDNYDEMTADPDINPFRVLGNITNNDKGVIFYTKDTEYHTECYGNQPGISRYTFYLFDSVTKSEKPLLEFTRPVDGLYLNFFGYYDKNLVFQREMKSDNEFSLVSIIDGRQKTLPIPNHRDLLPCFHNDEPWLFPNRLIFYLDSSQLIQYNIDSQEKKVIIPETDSDCMRGNYDPANEKLSLLYGFVEFGMGELKSITVDIKKNKISEKTVKFNYPECYSFSPEKCTTEEEKLIKINDEKMKEFDDVFKEKNIPTTSSCSGIGLDYKISSSSERILILDGKEFTNGEFIACLE